MTHNQVVPGSSPGGTTFWKIELFLENQKASILEAFFMFVW